MEAVAESPDTSASSASITATATATATVSSPPDTAHLLTSPSHVWHSDVRECPVTALSAMCARYTINTGAEGNAAAGAIALRKGLDGSNPAGRPR